MRSTIDRLPEHLKRYLVDQNYSKYTSEDQAVWRYILRQLKDFLSTHAHKAYLIGLEKTGITEDEIPHIETIDEMLRSFGWGAVPISGFIPPAAFMEFQSLGVLPIATDLRTLEHIHYTPAPDIVHESAGHAPILIDKHFSNYLKEYASIASNAIFSKEDLSIYEAIRELSDIKEDPFSTDSEIKAAEDNLQDTIKTIRYVSEATLLSRMNWWTAEYGLIGDLNSPKIFGAGLLSSIGEARSCLDDDVKKIPLTVNCIDTTYDITEKQPQLFVTENFENLVHVLRELSERMSYKRGGKFGLDRAIESETVNTVVFNSGLQASGVLTSYKSHDDEPCYLQFSGPSQLSINNQQIGGHGIANHKEGFGCPVGLLDNFSSCLSKANIEDLNRLGIIQGSLCQLNYSSGVSVSGKVKNILYPSDNPLIITFVDCTVSLNDTILFDPSWGEYDLGIGSSVVSVFGGAADREQYGDTIDFVAKKIPERQYSTEEKNLHQFYSDLKKLRVDKPSAESFISRLDDLVDDYVKMFKHHWLLGIELYELSRSSESSENTTQKLLNHLAELSLANSSYKLLIEDGIKLAK